MDKPVFTALVMDHLINQTCRDPRCLNEIGQIVLKILEEVD